MRGQTSLIFAWTAILSGIMIGSCSNSSTTVNAGEAGFTVAYFSRADLKAILRDTACAKVRFYNARRTADDLSGSVIMIGVRANGAELNSTMPYRLYDRLVSATVASISLGKASAQASCMYIKKPQKRYSAEFSKAEIDRLLNVKLCSGIQLVPITTPNGDWSMEMSPVRLSDATATAFMVRPALCSEPCPNYCGPERNYINIQGPLSQ